MMNEIADLESRISAAMARIGRALDNYSPGSGGSEQLEAMEEARAKAEAEVARLKGALSDEADAAAALREQVGEMESVAAEQQARIEELEGALDKMADQRRVDRAELDELIAALEPLVREHSNA